MARALYVSGDRALVRAEVQSLLQGERSFLCSFEGPLHVLRHLVLHSELGSLLIHEVFSAGSQSEECLALGPIRLAVLGTLFLFGLLAVGEVLRLGVVLVGAKIIPGGVTWVRRVFAARGRLSERAVPVTRVHHRGDHVVILRLLVPEERLVELVLFLLALADLVQS